MLYAIGAGPERPDMPTELPASADTGLKALGRHHRRPCTTDGRPIEQDHHVGRSRARQVTAGPSRALPASLPYALHSAARQPSSGAGRCATRVSVRRRSRRAGRLQVADHCHFRSITTSRYSLGSTSVSSPERFRLPMRVSRSLVKADCFPASSAWKVLFIGP
jgi:hypothetical protein